MLINLKSFQTFELFLQTMQSLDKSIQHFYTFLHGALGENRGNFIIIQIIKHFRNNVAFKKEQQTQEFGYCAQDAVQ